MTKKGSETSERLIRRRNRNLWRIAVTPLAAALVIAVAYNLIIPAITMSRQVAYCGHEEHAHLPECYSEQGEIICGMEEHEHSLACYTDLNADIENVDLWEQEAPVPTGDRSADVLAVAKSLLGYRESEKNYLVAEGGETKGYTRFGHWYGLITGDGSAEEADEATQDGQTQALANGIPDYSYWDWDAMFVSYVLSYAGVGDMGSDTDAANWAASLAAAGRYVDAQDYVPSSGDLVFFAPYDDKPVMVGVVSYINNDFLGLGDGVKSISVICGDYDNQVSEIRIAMDESGDGDLSFGTIRGYGLLNPDAPSDNSGQAVSETDGGADAQGDLQNQVPADTTVAGEAAKALEGDKSLAGQTDESGQTSSDQTDKGGRSLVGGMDESDRTLADQMDEDDQSLASRTDTGKTSADADESGPLYEEQPGDEKQSDSANENPTDSDSMACTLLPGETRILTANGADYTVTMTYGAEAEIPDIAKLQVKEIKAGTDDYEECLSDTRETLGIDEEDADKLHGRFFDIKIMTKEGEFEPKAPVKVEISYKKPIEAAEASDFHAIHFGEDGTERIDVETSGEDDTVTAVEFAAESFSIYGVVYTVDFHYEEKESGKTYEFSLPGGGFVSFSELVEVLGIAKAADYDESSDVDLSEEVSGISEKTREFVANVESVVFSNPELVWVGKVNESTTVGTLKEENGLEVQYDAELTSEQIEEIDAQTVQAGDWALISVLPFESEESLTVTMKDGEQFVVVVTDTQAVAISSIANLDGKEYALVNVHQGSVVLPEDQGTGENDNYRLRADICSENNLKSTTPTWKFEKVEGTSDQFYISSGGKYLNIHQTTRYTYHYRTDLNNVGDVTVSSTKQALKVSYDANNEAIQIESSDGFKLDLWNWNASYGFGAYKTSQANRRNQEFKLVPVFRVQDNTPFVIYYKMADGKYKALGIDANGNATMQNCANKEALDKLPSSFLWTFRHVYDENGDFYYEIASVSDPQSKLTLIGNSQNIVQKGGSTVVVNAWNNGTTADDGIQMHFMPNGYNSPVYLRNEGGNDNYFFPYQIGNENEWPQTRMYLYEQEPVEAIEFTVRTENADYGLVHDDDHAGINGVGVENFTSIASVMNDGTHDKYNTTTITAIDGGPLGLYDKYKYIFDYWDLDGARIGAGQTIDLRTQKIPETGSVLTAHFKRNPEYEARDEDKQGRFIDKDSLNQWLKDLESSQLPLDPDACGKTAEVVDYENRIYRVDLTARSSLSTFAGDIDLGFMIDVSASMKFPSKLDAIPGKNNVNLWVINDNNLNKANMLTQRTEPYYIIADASGTATVCAIRWDGSNWQWKDASKDDTEYDIITSNKNNMGNQFHRKDSDKYKNGATILYQIYEDGDSGKLRRDYLESSINGTIDTLSDILDILSLASDTSKNPDVKIAWNTFCNALPNGSGGRQREFLSAKSDNISLAYAYAGGTSTDIALLDAAGYSRKDLIDRGYSRFDSNNSKNWHRTTADYDGEYYGITGRYTAEYLKSSNTGEDAYGFTWSTEPNTPKYAVLITDGAPQRSGYDIDRRYVEEAANLLKDRGVTLITVGLSMGNVDVGRRLLYDIASRDAENDPYFYEANTGDELEHVLYSIIQTILQDCSVYGDVTDTVGEAFYPVDKATGRPLVNGDWIKLNGEVIDDKTAWEDQPHGIVTKTGDTYTVTWTDQTFAPTDTGWHGSIYVKAKEDFLGGNVVKTNKTNAKIEAKQYSIGGSGKIDLANSRTTYTYQDPTDPTNTITSEYRSVIDDIETPRVNVNELQFTENSTSWTVYTGTNVDPLTQLKALYDNIKVEEVVKTAQTIDNNPLPNQAVSEDSLRFELMESESDYRTPSDEAVTFYIKDIISQLDPNALDWDELVRLSNLSGDANTGISWTYDLYNQDNPGTINIKLTKDHAPTSHKAETLGAPAESYTLTVKFSPSYTHLPVSQKGDGAVPYHTGTWGLGQPGAAMGTESSTNSHAINVVRRMVEIKKVDEDGELLKEAKFKIYQKDAGGNEINARTVTTENGILTLDPVVPDEDQGIPGEYWADKTTWYICETEAPAERQIYEGEIKVELEMGDEVTTIMDQNAATHPYNWNQSPSLTVSGEDEYVKVEVKQQDILIPGTQQSTGIKETVGATLSILNKLIIDIDVIKLDTLENRLAGAVFKLVKDCEVMTSNDYEIVKLGTNESVAVDDEGCFTVPAEGVTLKKLGAGEYTLTEVDAPAGYVITIKPVKFTIRNDDDAAKRVTFDNPQDNPNGKVAAGNDDRQYTIKNEPGAALPSTGGFGTMLFYLPGIMLAGIASVGLVMRRKNRIVA